MDFQLHEKFQTGTVIFEIVNIVPVVKTFSKLEIRIKECGLLSNWSIDCGSDELEKGILSGQVRRLE